MRVKIKERIFIGPQTKEILIDRNFDEVLEAFRLVVYNFVSRCKAPNHREFVEGLHG